MTNGPFLRSLASLAFLCALSLPATAGEVRDAAKAVLELFTSQGCSSCPPADALLKEMASRPDVIALAYHVDYWDYMGWKDTFGTETNTERQRNYAASSGSARIYTPQLVLNGTTSVVGSQKSAVADALAEQSLPVPIKLTMTKDKLVVDVGINPGLPNAVVWMVNYMDKADVDIAAGENGGRKIAYTQVVTGHQMVGMWEASEGTEIKLPLKEVFAGKANGAAILVQIDNDGKPGRIVGAASVAR